MPNFDRYNKLHDEIMKRLEDGEITTERAKEVNDLAFEKYILEAAISPVLLSTAIIGGMIVSGISSIKKDMKKDEINKIEKQKQQDAEEEKFVKNIVSDINSNKEVFTLNGEELKINSYDDVFKMIVKDVKILVNYINHNSTYKQKIKKEIDEAIDEHREWLNNKNLSKDEFNKQLQDFIDDIKDYKIVCKPENDAILVVDGTQDACTSITIIDDIIRVLNMKYQYVLPKFNLKIGFGDGDEGMITLDKVKNTKK